MNEIKISALIPYDGRIDNIKLVLESLANQTMNKNNFEVVIGIMGHCTDYIKLCQEFDNRLNITNIINSRPWHVSFARNIAIKQALGKILLFLDPNILIGKQLLKNLYERHYLYQQNQCVIGQIIDYDNNNSIPDKKELKPYNFYIEKVAELELLEEFDYDRRLDVPNIIPWTLLGSSFVAIPKELIDKNNLYFDLNLTGNGVDYLEWGYRICKCHIPISIKKDIWGIYLPHENSLINNNSSEIKNIRYFLNKWPNFDVELTCTFGELMSNSVFFELKNEISNVTKDNTSSLIALVSKNEISKSLILGITKKQDGNYGNTDRLLYEFNTINNFKELSIIGLNLPFENDSIDTCYILPSLAKLSAKYYDQILKESNRVAKLVVLK